MQTLRMREPGITGEDEPEYTQIRPVDRTARRFRSLRTVSAQWSLVGMFERSESPSHRSLVVNPIPQKPDIRGFTGRLPSPCCRFSSSAAAGPECSCSFRDLLRHANHATRLALFGAGNRSVPGSASRRSCLAVAQEAGRGGQVGGDVCRDGPAAVDLPCLRGRFRPTWPGSPSPTSATICCAPPNPWPASATPTGRRHAAPRPHRRRGPHRPPRQWRNSLCARPKAGPADRRIRLFQPPAALGGHTPQPRDQEDHRKPPPRHAARPPCPHLPGETPCRHPVARCISIQFSLTSAHRQIRMSILFSVARRFPPIRRLGP